MRYIDKILEQIEQCIITNTFKSVETEKLELKDLSASENWKELYKTICAFLNTQGGIIVIGIKEDVKNQQFKFTGYNSNNEAKIKEIPKQFTEEKRRSLELSPYIRADAMEVVAFMDGLVCILFVEKLPDEEKYVFYNKEAYQRLLTGDHRIPEEKIRKQIELREEIVSTKVLEIVPGASLDDLDVDKLNEFIILLNQDKKVETLKADIASAEQFLTWKRMLREGKPTILGMLVCGKNYEYFLEERCELDAYFETRINKTIADDKKIYKDNIIQLMQSAFTFVHSKIGIGISAENGGTAVLEYPEEIIRETINNALAHRDYTQNRFSTLVIKNDEAIVITNPGKFRQEQMFAEESPIRLRRIIPIPKAQNPHLADILKIYNRWEGRGIGMASLVNYALNNKIDVPFFLLSTQNEICLTIPKGKVFDRKCELWLTSFNKYLTEKTEGTDLTPEQKSVLSYFYKCEKLNERERWTINLTQGNNHFNTIADLEKWGLVYRLPQSSPELPVYGVDPVLRKASFHTELHAIFGDDYIVLHNDYKDVLNAVYHHNLYSTVPEVSARLICQFLYFKQNGPKTDIKEFENYRRKIRYIINRLEKLEYIRRKEARKPDYEINKGYKTQSLNLTFDGGKK
ncbi:MAG: putative DNA binding domain-containing protein [Treponema sp.]|jgi:predicted HTH transcriptional regulator|nr:putative DNA binding domain-containing protein [Treponema sp.]